MIPALRKHPAPFSRLLCSQLWKLAVACSADPVDFAKESRLLLDYIGRVSRNEPLTPVAPAPAEASFSGFGEPVPC